MARIDLVCRLCMGVKNLVHSIFESGFEAKLKNCFDIDAKLNENLPSIICALCSLKVKDFYEFKENCSKVQELLMKEYGPKIESNEPIEGIVENLEHELPNQLIEYTIEILSTKEENAKIDSPKNRKLERKKADDLENEPTNTKARNEKEIYKSLLTSCDICGKQIEKNRMEGHRNQHLGKRPYKCAAEDCGLLFHCKIALRLHNKNRHSDERHPCPICEKIYNSKKSLYHHTKETHNDKKFTCVDCGQSFVTNSRLSRHRIIHVGRRDFECPECSKTFYRSNNLKIHMRSHTKEKPYKCELCNKAFGYNRLLKEHVDRVHSPSEKKI